ncbi:hypothetical protein R1flu_016082 [Riccia fluitans]|uniref:Uncharacterized protein n=1 Tax=Riccia fluitans TaxID=41844 RepID=A0ABD1YKT5_9MARC
MITHAKSAAGGLSCMKGLHLEGAVLMAISSALNAMLSVDELLKYEGLSVTATCIKNVNLNVTDDQLAEIVSPNQPFWRGKLREDVEFPEDTVDTEYRI